MNQKTQLYCIAIGIIAIIVGVVVFSIEDNSPLDLTTVNTSVLDEYVIVVPESFGAVVSISMDDSFTVILFEKGVFSGYLGGSIFYIVWEES